MNKILLLLILLFSINLKAEEKLIEISNEELDFLSNHGLLSFFGEVTGIGGKIAISQIDSFVTLKNEVIPLKKTAVLISQGKSPTTDNILSIKFGEIFIARNELLGVILK
jgi:hypothetical protein